MRRSELIRRRWQRSLGLSHDPSKESAVDGRGTSCEQNKRGIWNKQATIVEVPVIRIARESLALVSVASFVWMMCSVAQLVA
jgi:hypothetical protein